MDSSTTATDKAPHKVVESDMEAGFAPEKPRSNATEVMEASALLMLWSLLVINEGAIRFQSSEASNLDRPGEIFSPYLVFFGGLAEVIFGLVGFFVGYAAFVPRFYSAGVTKIAILVQNILGWFVFIVFVFARPANMAAKLQAGLNPDLSLGVSRFLITLGIFTSFHFCLALQGGQFVFLARLVCAVTGEDFLKQQSGHRMRALFWNGNMALAGFWTFLTGAIIRGEMGPGKLPAPYEFPPNVGTLPSVTIITGIVLLVWGLAGMSMAVMNQAPGYYFMVTAVVYVIALLNYGIFQFGFFGNGAHGGPVAMHNGLVFMVVFLGPYFVHKNAKSKLAEM